MCFRPAYTKWWEYVQTIMLRVHTYRNRLCVQKNNYISAENSGADMKNKTWINTDKK